MDGQNKGNKKRIMENEQCEDKLQRYVAKTYGYKKPFPPQMNLRGLKSIP